MKIKQVIVVEGKTDTAKLKKIFNGDVDTIETNGLSLNNNTLNLIADVNRTRGVIIFTDPDGPGIKIREKINSYLNFKCLNAFINKKTIKNVKKIGIAEANDEEIVKSLSNLVEFKGEDNFLMSWEEYLKNDFWKKENRKIIAEQFNWSEKINTKTLYRYINYSGLKVEDVIEILKR